MMDSPDVDPVTRNRQAGPPGLPVIRGLAVAGLLVSGYLLFVSLGQQRLPVGCGAGSGCASVLASRWSSVLGLPVGGAAVAIYFVVLAATFCVGSHRSARLQAAGWNLLIGAAATIVAAANWFIWLQVGVLQAICPWCMVDHAIGLSVAVAIAFSAWGILRRTLSRVQTAPDDHPPAIIAPVVPRFRVVTPVVAGIGAVMLLAGTQWMFEGSTGRTIRLPPGKNADTGPGTNRRIAVIDGKFQVSPHEQPVLGSADSPKLLIVLFDYCCPHCRAAHGYLIHSLSAFDGQLSVLLLPMPMDHKCNKTLDHTEPRFEHACELARLALAVWRAKPAEFAAYDKWLFEPEQPRDPAEAHRKAAELVGATLLESTLNDPWINQQIAANVQAYADSGADRIPIIMSPGFSSIVGRPESEEQLLQTLRDELKVQAAEVATP